MLERDNKYLQGKNLHCGLHRLFESLRHWGELAFFSSLEVLSPRAAPLPSGHAEGDISPKARPLSHTPATICPLGTWHLVHMDLLGGREGARTCLCGGTSRRGELMQPSQQGQGLPHV